MDVQYTNTSGDAGVGQIAAEDWAVIEEARQQIIDRELEVKELTYSEL